MKINNIQINSFGRLKEKEFKLNNNINIIYGKNEAGKSTLLKYIISSFYGISKNKKGKNISDYDKYKPWVGEEFSGKIEYELDNHDRFEIFRDFNKKSPKIFNGNMEDITKQFSVDKNKQSQFFEEQTNIDEELFLSTLIINQQEVKLEKQEQSVLIQKIANLVGTGEDAKSYKLIIDRLNRRQLDEVGSQKSREKPINVICNKLETIEQEKQNLSKFLSQKYEIEENKNKLIEEKIDSENKFEFLKEIKLLIENEKIEKEKINIKENIENENREKINLLKDKINNLNKRYLDKNLNTNKRSKFFEDSSKLVTDVEHKEESSRNKKMYLDRNLNIKLIIFFIILILINAVTFNLMKNNNFKYIFLLTVPMFLIFCAFVLINKKNRIKNMQKINLEEKNKLNNEINLIEANNLNLENELNKLKNNFNLKNNLEKEKIKNKYLLKIEINYLNKYLNINNYEIINIEKENIENELNKNKLEIHKLEIDKNNIESKLDNLSNLEEELEIYNEKYRELVKLDKSMNLVKEVLEKCYEEMKSTVTPKFTQNLSYNINKITDGKYTNVKFSEENGLTVELENGDYKQADNLSVGTTDQLYLSLRFSMINELSEEKLPIILDEAFAYYDNERLENILKYIYNEFKDRQVIIFTCTNREKNILKNTNINFNLIEI